MNAVNIVVQTLDNRFVVFHQNKYAIPGDTLSPVGGFIDDGESPFTAARREVLEELGLGSRKTLERVAEAVITSEEGLHNNDGGSSSVSALSVSQVKNAISQTALPILDSTGLPGGQVENDPDWVFLGRYRTAANRGGGFLYSYLLKNAVPLVQGGGILAYVGSGDDEQQEILYLTEDEVLEAVSEGKFQEVKWAATFALSLLHLKVGMPGCCAENK